ncbi:MAG: hypothetical protein AMK73_03700, partial [Planctomycetes bacterium SM23_32]
ARAWQDNSGWARVIVEYRQVQEEPHGGQSAQRIVVERISDGAVQLIQGPVELQEGGPYRACVFARTPHAVPLRIQVRRPGAPYTTYAGRTFRPGPEWTACQFAFSSPVSGPALFMIMPEDHGMVDVDDASLEPAPPDSDVPPKEGNLLVTGRMVGAVANGWAPGRDEPDEHLDSPPPWDMQAAYRYVPPSAEEPDPHVVIRGEDAAQVSLYSPPVVVNAGRTHTLSLDMRAEPGGIEVWLTVEDSERRSGIRRAVTVTDRWTRYTASGQLPLAEGSAFAVRICPLAEGDLHVRNVQLVEGEGPVEFEPAVRVEVAVIPEAPNGLVFDGEPAALSLIGAGDVPEGARVELAVHDLYGNVRRLPNLALAAGNRFEERVSLEAAPEGARGLFRVEARVLDAAGHAISNVGQGLVARVPRPRYPDRLLPDSAFGAHIPLDAPSARLARNLGIKWCRIHDASFITTWAAAEPEPGQWRFFDDRVELVRSHGIMVLGMLDCAPAWASDAPDDVRGYFRRYYVPNDVDAWADYCRAVVAHYAGLVDHWEVWNEPWVGSFFRKVVDGEQVGGTPEDYVPLLRAAYTAAREANPDAVVVGVDTYFTEWTKGCLEAGAGGWFDVFSFHQYTERMPGTPHGPVASMVGGHRALLAEHGLGDVEVWHTEGGNAAPATFYRGLDPLVTSDGTREAVWYARYLLTALSLDVRKFFLYTLHAYPRLGAHGFTPLEPGGYLQPWAIAQANLAHLIEGTRFRRRIRTDDGVVCLTFEGDGRQVAALFAERDAVPAGELTGTAAVDLWGNATTLQEIARAPVYLTGTAAATVMRALEEPQAHRAGRPPEARKPYGLARVPSPAF